MFIDQAPSDAKYTLRSYSGYFDTCTVSKSQIIMEIHMSSFMTKCQNHPHHPHNDLNE